MWTSFAINSVLDVWLDFSTPLKIIYSGNTHKTNFNSFCKVTGSKTLIWIKQDSCNYWKGQKLRNVFINLQLTGNRNILWPFPGNIETKMVLWSTQNQCCFNVEFRRWFNFDKETLFRRWNTVTSSMLSFSGIMI